MGNCSLRSRCGKYKKMSYRDIIVFFSIFAEKNNCNMADKITVYSSFNLQDKAAVKAFEQQLDAENISYKSCLHKEDVHYISDFEEEISNGSIVVIFYRYDYFTSPHCMNEYAMIRQKVPNDCIFAVKCENIDFNGREDDLVEWWSGKQGRYGKKNLTTIEEEYKSARKHGFYLEEAHDYSIQKLKTFFRNLLYDKPDKLGELIKKIKTKIAEIEEQTSSNTPSDNNTVGEELPKLTFDTRTDIVKRDDVTSIIKDLFVTNQIVNMIGVGGCGKTTIVECFINRFRNEYNNIFGVIINKDFYNEFAEKCLNQIFKGDLILRAYHLGKSGESRSYSTKEAFFIDSISFLEKYSSDGDKYNLLIIDINEFADYDNIEKALDYIRDNKRLRNWKILVVSREKMESASVHFDALKLNTAEVDFHVLEAIFRHYLKGDERYCFTQEQLEFLFLKLGHLPILIEHLAYYLHETSEVRTFEFIVEYLGDGFEDHKMWSRKYEKIQEFLSKLMSFDYLDDMQKRIVRLLVIWPAEYYSAKLIRRFMSVNDDSTPKFVNAVDDSLNILADKCVLDSKDVENTRLYKIHDLISGQFRKQIFEEQCISDLMRDYSTYVCIVKYFIKTGNNIDLITSKCITNTPLDVFGIGSDKDYTVYEDWQFLRGLAKISLNCYLSELAYKAKLLRILYHLSGKEIYEKVYGEYKNIYSHVIYYEWLEQQNDYSDIIDHNKYYGDDDIINHLVHDMISVPEGSYYKDGNKITISGFYLNKYQVTQREYLKLMNHNPSHFAKRDALDNPVESVTWYDCMDFIIELNLRTKLRFSLPTEAQWEYAAGWRKDGGRNVFSGCNDENVLNKYAWYDDNSEGITHMVGHKVFPNDLGIYDMSGNVYEWCQNCNDNYIIDATTNQHVHNCTDLRVVHGGSMFTTPRECRVLFGFALQPDFRFHGYGFRLALG